MNSLDFLRELNEVDDDLLRKAALPPVRASRRIGIKVPVAALMLCLLSVTVAAVSISIRIFTTGETAPNYENHYGGMFLSNSKVTTIQYDLSPRKVNIPLQWETALTEAWKSFGYDHEHFTGLDLKEGNGNRINYGGLPQMESLLGLNFADSEELEQITRAAYVTLVVTDAKRATEQFQREGLVSPDGIVIYLPFLRNAQTGLSPETVDYCGLNIFIPLTASFAEQYASHCVLSGVYGQDFAQRSFVSKGNVEVFLLENTKQGEEPLSAYGAWEQAGIGYLVELKTNWDAKELPGEILMPYLENLEDGT